MDLLARCALICALLALPVPTRAGAEPDNACNAPEELVTTDVSLGQLGAAIAAGGPVDLLAIGSAPTVGSVTASGEQTSASHGGAFPWQLVRALRAAVP